MTVLTADFETGTNTSSVSTGDTGSQTAWDAVVVGGGAITYDNTHVAHGSLAAAFPADASTSSLGWTTAFGTQSEYWGRTYLYFTSNPSAQFDLIKHLTTGVDLGWRIELDTAGKFIVTDRFTTIATFTNAVALNQWIRVEWHAKHTSTSQVEVVLFNTGDSITATETQTVNGDDILATVNDFRLIGGTSGPWTFWADQVVEKATAYPGPRPVNTTAPTVSGSTPVGSTLTATTGTWNAGATFNYSYQWTKGGVNVGGATSSTYVTQLGDAGGAMGCKVTATGTQATNEAATQASSNTVTVDGGAVHHSLASTGAGS